MKLLEDKWKKYFSTEAATLEWSTCLGSTSKRQGCSSVMDFSPHMHKALGSISSPVKTKEYLDKMLL